MLTTDQLLALAQAYCAATDTTLSVLGKRALGNRSVFQRLAEGYGCNSKSCEKATAWFQANWPADAAWPQEIAR